jgi:hypothetical protein
MLKGWKEEERMPRKDCMGEWKERDVEGQGTAACRIYEVEEDLKGMQVRRWWEKIRKRQEINCEGGQSPPRPVAPRKKEEESKCTSHFKESRVKLNLFCACH